MQKKIKPNTRKILETKENIRIIDIAKMANVSVGTVDRVLHNRGRVSEEKRRKVEEVLKNINYKPNVVARFLASKRTFSFAVIIPSYAEGEYWELVSTGVEKAVGELSNFNVRVDYLHFDQFDDSSMNHVIAQLKENDYAGAVISTVHKNKVLEIVRLLSSMKTPYVFIDSNLDCNKLAYYGIDSHVSGAIGAKLMMSHISSDDTILIVQTIYKGHVPSMQTESRESGFRTYLNDHSFGGDIRSFSFNPNEKEIYAKQLNLILKDLKGKIGVIIFNSRIYELVNLVELMENNQNIFKLIGYDTIEKNKNALKEDKISYLISQRSIQQGYESVKALSTHLIFNGSLTTDNYMPIDILIKENIDFYYD